MVGGIRTDLLVTAVLLFLTQTGIQCRAENDSSSVTLPNWRTNSEYVTQCVLNSDTNLLCDWTRAQRGTVSSLESNVLRLEGEACLEFWYLAPVTSDLKVLLKSSTGLVEIWTSPALDRGSWRQVFVPLSITETGTQVVFEAVQGLSIEEQVAVDHIGVRRGQCGQQCEPDTEFWTDESTHCLCSGGQLSCSSSQRQSSSDNSTLATCTVHSDPHCSTFDGALFRFMAPCTYVLAKTCSPTEALPLFSVEVVSERKDNSSVSAVQQVNVELKNHRVSLLKRQTHRVMVNGIWRMLPLSLNGGTVKIRSNPAAVVVETSFDLFVSYDSAGAVHVTVPDTYSSKVCGMCGNFNNRGDDDYLMPDGSDAPDAVALAESWRTEGAASCETILIPHQCDPQEEAEYASEPYCGGLLSGTGPFSSCLSVLGAESYFRSCVVGMCTTHGDPAVLCETLQGYTDICQEAGVVVPAWRNSTLCPLECGENSHYNSCAEGCPEVCSSLDAAGSCGGCEERCECDPGFKLSGGKCVPAEDCGCWKNGQHYEKGTMFLEGECEEQCQCMGNNEVQCTTMHCADNEVCKIKDGEKGCFPLKPVTCSVYGDPHYITFDGRAYNFQGGCNYTLATTCGEQSSVQFTVTGRNMHPRLQNFTRSKLQTVALQVDGLHLTMHQSGDVDNSGVRLPYSTNGTYGSLSVYTKKQYVILETTFGLRMMIDRQNRLFLQVDERYWGAMCGLCGTYSYQQGDDFITPGGQNVTEPFEFADSWKVEDNTLCTAHPNNPRPCTAHEENLAYSECNKLLGQAFRSCHDSVHPQTHLTSCVYDYCDTNGDQHTLCESLESYVAACEVAGVELPHWQSGTACVCPLNCNFDNSLCGWEQLIQDSFDWKRQSGPTPSNPTGPNQDHTTGAGFFMYIEGDSVTHGDSARLLSSTCHYSGPVCLHFWYHMYGSAKAMALNMYLLEEGKVTKIWSKANNQGPEWLPAYADITVSGPFQIIVEGIRGSNAQSDVAIDDISIHFDSCSAGSPGLDSVTTLPPKTAEVFPSHQICSNLDCSFDSNLCRWSQMITDAFEWTWRSGSTPTMMTGPSADHTGGGHYLYMEASNMTHGDTARLLSSVCSDSGPQCLQFWYHMYGSADTMGLHVYLVQDRLADAVWWKRNDQGNMWRLAQVDFTTSGPFQIIFEGRRGSTDLSDVAIDDVSLHHGRCATSNNSQTTASNYSQTTASNNSQTTASNYRKTTTPNYTYTNQTTASNNSQTTASNYSQTTASNNSQTTASNYRKTTTPNYTYTNQTTASNNSQTTASNNSQTTASNNSQTTASNYRKTTASNYSQTTASNNSQTTASNYSQTTASNNSQTTASKYSQTTASNNSQTTASKYSQTTASNNSQTTTSNNSQTTASNNSQTTASKPQPPTTGRPQPPTTPIPTPSCPENSHYTTCIPACSPTCMNLHGPPGCNVNEPCAQGCVCDDGFVRKRSVCVPIQQCGCVDRNGSKHQFNEVWYTDHCSQKCECEKDDGVGEIECDDEDECDGNAVCLQNEKGQYDCKSTGFSECTVNGDPKYRTFDNMKHEFEGEHSYVLVQTTNLPNNLPEVYIEGINTASSDDQDDNEHDDDDSSEERDSHRDSRGRDDDDDDDDDEHDDDSHEHEEHRRLRELKIRVYNHTVEFKKHRKLVLDGRVTRPPVSPASGLKIRVHSSRIYLKTDFGLSVEFDGHSTAEIILPHMYKRKVGGMCGNFDGKKRNDLMKPDGSQAQSIEEFGESWRVTEDSLNIRWR
ncbi:zonadhesin [Centroberyx affinis]|uniref:zonadhesin n=1 Tax=Centroberyx affinis TaxID=166261 RepID=UPI003A5BC3D6